MSGNLQISQGLLAGLRTRQPGVIGEIVREHTRSLWRAARAMGVPETAAEDVVQETFATFLETLDRFEGRSQVRTWLFGILYKKVLEFRREQATEQRHDPIDDVFESRFDALGNWVRPPQDLQRQLESREAGEMIRRCMESLPPSQRAAFTLREIEGAESQEICKILGVSATNLGVLMHRARSRLRECLEAMGVRKR